MMVLEECADRLGIKVLPVAVKAFVVAVIVRIMSDKDSMEARNAIAHSYLQVKPGL
jgi:hypothetical protein